jgi:hypothetical protein
MALGISRAFTIFIANSSNLHFFMNRALLLLLVVMGCLRLQGQMGLHVGLMGGPQYTMMLNNEPLNPDENGFQYVATWGKTYTFKLGYNIVPPIGIHATATYSLQGQDYTSVDSTGRQITTSRRAQYLKFPLLLHLSSTPGPVMFVMEFGPQLGVVRQASITIDGTPLGVPFQHTLLWKPLDLEFAWCLGVEFGITPGFHLVLQHRGDYGILDFEDKGFSENGIPFYDIQRRKAINMTLAIVAGVNFIPNFGHSKTTRHYRGRTWRNNWR